MQPLSGNQRPDLLTSLINMSLVRRLPQKVHLCRSSSKCPTPAIVFGNAIKTLTFCSLTSERPKVARTCGAFNILTSKCASRHNGVHFFDISTSKSGLNPSVFFNTFDFDMCFAPQRRALCRHHNFEKCSEREVFLAFSLANVLRATTACTFSTSQLRKVFRTWGIFSFSLANVLRATTACNFPSLIWPDGSAPAALASLLFDPPEPQIIGKTQCFATFLLFSSGTFSFLIFFLLLFSSLTLPISAFHLSILSEV